MSFHENSIFRYTLFWTKKHQKLFIIKLLAFICSKIAYDIDQLSGIEPLQKILFVFGGSKKHCIVFKLLKKIVCITNCINGSVWKRFYRLLTEIITLKFPSSWTFPPWWQGEKVLSLPGLREEKYFTSL